MDACVALLLFFYILRNSFKFKRLHIMYCLVPIVKQIFSSIHCGQTVLVSD